MVDVCCWYCWLVLLPLLGDVCWLVPQPGPSGVVAINAAGLGCCCLMLKCSFPLWYARIVLDRTTYSTIAVLLLCATAVLLLCYCYATAMTCVIFTLLCFYPTTSLHDSSILKLTGTHQLQSTKRTALLPVALAAHEYRV